MIEIPLNANPEQLFSANVSGGTYDFRVMYNSRTEAWSISVAQSGQPIVSGVAMLGGVDIFKQYNLPIKNIFVVNVDDATLDASADNLGSAVKLIIATDDELANG